MRLHLPLFLPDQTCAYTTRGTGLTCGAAMDVWGDHPNSCCHAHVVFRHHAVRDELSRLAQHASVPSAVEQVISLVPQLAPPNPLVLDEHAVPTPSTQPSDSLQHADNLDLGCTPTEADLSMPCSDAPSIAAAPLAIATHERRADLVCAPADRARILIDVAIVHCPASDNAAHRIRAVELAKQMEYGVQAPSNRTPAGDRMHPFVMTSLGVFGPQSLAFLWQMAGLQLC